MKFAILDATGRPVSVFDAQEAARSVFVEEYGHRQDFFLMNILPMMTLDQYLELPPELRCFSNGRPSVMLSEAKSGIPRLSYVYLIDRWEAVQLPGGQRVETDDPAEQIQPA